MDSAKEDTEFLAHRKATEDGKATEDNQIADGHPTLNRLSDNY
jgi:hypothetical protein